MNCGSAEDYPTAMDGVDEWGCHIHPGCVSGQELVYCTGSHGHDYPFRGNYTEGLSILWDFMKSHRKD